MKLVFTETMGYAKRITDSFPKDEVITSREAWTRTSSSKWREVLM